VLPVAPARAGSREKPVASRDFDPAASPLRVFGAMLRRYRTRAGMSLEQLGARVYLSDDMVGKIENGQRVPTEQFAAACDAVPELNTGGALGELRELLKDHLKQRAYPGWFARWPDKEADAKILRSFEMVVVPGLLQTPDYARALLANRIGASPDDVDEIVAARMERSPSSPGTSLRSCGSSSMKRFCTGRSAGHT
jgi:transcriptional regulator with XRE-family HTH domain